jgi:hypothetical protein
MAAGAAGLVFKGVFVLCLDAFLQALLLHNSIIKHAVYQNVGWVVEQEGDSFSVVFHEAEDAVAFTLQVGQDGAALQPA